ncbi:MAG: nicotinate-nucleotide adenylyltransferase [Proteobacteria bacterium]|nr:nicotinate-nucleotide adenylyltransferase [Pseudomonadota bacterium]
MNVPIYNMNKAEGILGGTFDPIHCGHLAVADFVAKQCSLAKIHFIPCLEPPHRFKPQASAAHRLEMVKLATAGHPQWIANDIDYHRPAPSFMIDTLRILREQQPDTPWCLILGMDAFNSFNQWRDWRNILSFCHLIVVNRPGFAVPKEPWAQELLSQTIINNPQQLITSLYGQLLLLEMPPSDISATQIRNQLNQLENTVPAKVLNYIQKHALYNN